MKPTMDNNYWIDLFAREKERVIEALGRMTEGGIVERIEHVGATSVPGLVGRPCVDIAMAVWPFPLEDTALHALATLSYELDLDFAVAPEQRFRHSSAQFRLYIVEAGSALWTDYILVREYLRHDEAARQALTARKQGWEGNTGSIEYREAKRQWFDQILGDAHRSWIEHEGFSPLHFVIEELRDFASPWYISGGWALDAFLGRVTRVHQDVDVEIPRADQLALQQYMTARGWKLLTPFEGRLQSWPMHMRLEMPRHQVHAHRSGAFIDFLMNDREGGVWRYRREPAIIRNIDRIEMHSDDGIPFLAPELVLLFKSKNTSGKERSKDQADFEGAYIRLEPERKAWLRWALIAIDPSHPWIERL